MSPLPRPKNPTAAAIAGTLGGVILIFIALAWTLIEFPDTPEAPDDPAPKPLGAEAHDGNTNAVLRDVENRRGLNERTHGKGAPVDRLAGRKDLQDDGFSADVHHRNITQKRESLQQA